MILDTLRAYPIHPTAEELYTILKDTVEATVSLATVYRNLGQLADAGMILRISVPDSPASTHITAFISRLSSRNTSMYISVTPGASK